MIRTPRSFCPLILLALLVTPQAHAHPLDDLSPEELVVCDEVIRQSGRFAVDLRYPIVAAQEPDKEAMLAYGRTGAPIARQAFAVVFEKGANRLFEVVVDLAGRTLAQVTEVKGRQPPLLFEEYDRAAALVRADARWQAALAKRGLDPNDIWLDGWAPGVETPQERKLGKRLMRGVPFLRGKIKNAYSRPIEGLVATLDMNADKVVEVMDLGVEPMVPGQELVPKPVSKLGLPLKALTVSQPEGPSFTVKGQQVTWQNWVFHYSMRPVEGLVIHTLNYRDDTQERSVLYKGALAEMLVPYGDPKKTWSFRSAFDVGQYGIGRTAHILQPGIDAPDNAVYRDAYFADDQGRVMKAPRAVAIYERERGVLWKHFDQFTRETAALRARQLVITFSTTIGNYDYGVNWILHADGVVEVEAHLTGIMLAKGSPLTKNPCSQSCQHLVEPNIVTPNHQHFFAFRLDLDVDGPKNTAVELNTAALPLGVSNPDGNAFEMTQTILARAGQASRDLNLATARKWKVLNANVENAMAHPVGYTLIPGENAVPYLHPTSPMRQQAAFINHPVWFTKYHANQQHPAGDYPYQDHSGDGLSKWVAANENLQNEDVVLWYVFGITHHARPEEWPVMSEHRAGFKLVPSNFFSRNPSTMRQAVMPGVAPPF